MYRSLQGCLIGAAKRVAPKSFRALQRVYDSPEDPIDDRHTTAEGEMSMSDDGIMNRITGLFCKVRASMTGAEKTAISGADHRVDATGEGVAERRRDASGEIGEPTDDEVQLSDKATQALNDAADKFGGLIDKTKSTPGDRGPKR